MSVKPRECFVAYPRLSVGSPCCLCVSRVHIVTSEPFDRSAPDLLWASHHCRPPNVVSQSVSQSVSSATHSDVGTCEFKVAVMQV